MMNTKLEVRKSNANSVPSVQSKKLKRYPNIITSDTPSPKSIRIGGVQLYIHNSKTV